MLVEEIESKRPTKKKGSMQMLEREETVLKNKF